MNTRQTKSSRCLHPFCSACGVAWTDHLGIAGTCKKLDEARGALKVICTWATFRGGECLTPKDTEKLCRKALEASKPNDQGYRSQPGADAATKKDSE